MDLSAELMEMQLSPPVGLGAAGISHHISCHQGFLWPLSQGQRRLTPYSFGASTGLGRSARHAILLLTNVLLSLAVERNP